jgi:hypothetical protein
MAKNGHEDLLDSSTKLRQLEIPGAGRKRDKRGDLLCSELLEIVEQEKALRRAKQEAQGKVQLWLAEKGWPAYVFVDGSTRFMVTLEASEKVKVQRIGSKNAEDEGVAA